MVVSASTTYKNNSWILVQKLCDATSKFIVVVVVAVSVIVDSISICFSASCECVSSLERFGCFRSMKIRNIFIVYAAENRHTWRYIDD